MEYLQGKDRTQLTLYSTCLDDMVPPDNTVRLIDLFVDSLNFEEMGFLRPYATLMRRFESYNNSLASPVF